MVADIFIYPKNYSGTVFPRVKEPLWCEPITVTVGYYRDGILFYETSFRSGDTYYLGKVRDVRHARQPQEVSKLAYTNRIVYSHIQEIIVRNWKPNDKSDVRKTLFILNYLIFEKGGKKRTTSQHDTKHVNNFCRHPLSFCHETMTIIQEQFLVRWGLQSCEVPNFIHYAGTWVKRATFFATPEASRNKRKVGQKSSNSSVKQENLLLTVIL